MSKLVLIVCIAGSVSLGFSLGVRNTTVSIAGPQVDIRSLDPSPMPQDLKKGHYSPRLLAKRTIPLDFLSPDARVGTVRFDHNGHVFIKVRPSAEKEPDRVYLLKLNIRQPESTRSDYEEMTIPNIAKGQFFMDFVVAENGNIYVALHKPRNKGVILVLSGVGDPLSVIETDNFLPGKLVVDREDRIWATGQLVGSSSAGEFLSDVQLRIYNSADGKLIAIPCGGFEAQDAGLSHLVTDSDRSNIWLITDSHKVVYQFSGTNLIEAHTYPFGDRLDSSQQLRLGRRFVGASQVNGSYVWYGVNEGDGQPVGFIGLTTISGSPLTNEVTLPVAFRNVVGIDPQGHVCALSATKVAGETVTVLRIAKLSMTKIIDRVRRR